MKRGGAVLLAVGIPLVIAGLGLAVGVIWTEREPLETHLADTAALAIIIGLMVAAAGGFLRWGERLR